MGLDEHLPSEGRLVGRDRWLVPMSLGLSYLANDGEELLTMADSLPATLDRLPFAPPLLRRAAGGMTRRHVAIGVASMGVLYAAAVADGVRTGGRGRLYQDVQLGFGLHGFGHLGASLLTRGYTSGVLTSPAVVIPQLWWARRRLAAAGVPDVADLRRAVAVMGSWLVVSHALGAVVDRAK